jgi:cytochrome c biogenesis protein CcmG/thiol:disulfide interchange protein DsbE
MAHPATPNPPRGAQLHLNPQGPRASLNRGKRHSLVLCLAITLGMAWLHTPAHAVEPGQQVPDIELSGVPGVAKLSDLRGKVVYVDFWASWCAPCKQSFPWMDEMQRKYADRGLRIVAINVDAKRSDADKFLATSPVSFAIAFDAKGDSARRLAVKGMPTSVLVAGDGKVLYVHRGFRLDERAELEARLAAALGVKVP